MNGRRALRVVPVGGVAVAGVLLGHWLAYLTAVPQDHARAALLAATGHGYWSEAVRLAVALGVCGFAALVMSHLGSGPSPADRPRFSTLLLRLGAIQSPAFLAIEVVERLAAHAPVASLLTVRVLVLGVAFQILTSCLGAILLGLLDRAVEAVVIALRRRAPRRPTVDWYGPSAVPFRPRPALAGASGVRGPPLR